MSLHRVLRVALVAVLACTFTGPVAVEQEASAATSAVIQIDPQHTLLLSASAALSPLGREDVPEFAGVRDAVHRFDLMTDGRRVGTLAVTVRTLPAGNIAVFSRLDAPANQVHVDLELRTPADSYNFRGLDPQTQPDPPLDRHFGYDRTTNPIGFVEIVRGGQRTSSLFLGKAYEFRELRESYPGGKVSWVKEFVREDAAYSVGRVGSSASIKLFMSGDSTSCERYFVLSPRPILEGSLGSTDMGMFTQTRFRWLDSTGPYMKGPWSIEPSTRDGYIRSLQQLRSPAVIREAVETGSPFMSDMAYNALYSLWRLRDRDGLWRTHWTSTWVGAESGIVAPYVDSRHNELIALWFLQFARSMGVSPELAAQLDTMALPYADFLVERAGKGEVIRTGEGYFFPAYFNDSGGTHSFATLNHSLGVMHYLIRTYQETGRAKYLITALAIRDAVSETTPGWIRESGDLWYGIKSSGVFFDQDYPTLTLTDLVFGQELLETVIGRGEPAFDALIQSKVTFLNSSALAGSALGDSSARPSPGEHTDGDVVDHTASSHLPGGWWAAPDATEPYADSMTPADSRTIGSETPDALSSKRTSVLTLPELGDLPVTGTLGSGESSALYRVRIPEGRIVRVRLVGPAASDYNMLLYAPGGTPGVTEPVAIRATYLYPETLSYTLPPGQGGDYVLEVRARWGAGSYTLSREILVPAHSELTDALPAESPLTGRLQLLYNRRDTHYIRLEEGDHVYATVTASTPNSIGVRLLGPDARSATDAGSLGPAYADRVSYTVPPGGAGAYYFDVHCLIGGGTYRVDYTVRRLEESEQLPGVEFASEEPTVGSVHWGQRPREVRWIDLEAGETMRFALRRATWGAPIDANLYSPGTSSLAEPAVASARGWGREVGLKYTVPQDGAGRYYVVVHSSSGSGTYALTATRGGALTSVGGENRFATAAAASKRAYPDGLAPAGERAVVIATGRNWPDALGGAALAGVLDAPILLSDRDVLPEVTSAEITRLGAQKAVILGGVAAVGAPVEAALKSALGPANVTRIAGGSRYETADAVARRVIELRGAAYDGTAFVATGRNFADAVAAAPIAAAQGRPLYLVHPQSGLSQGTKAAMSSVTDVLILGGTSVVTSATESSLKATHGAERVTRLSGTSRYDTAAAIATYAVNNDGHVWNRVGITTGQRFPDALAGGVVQGKAGSVMLLTRPDRLETVTRDTLAVNKFYIANLTFFGGENAISPGVRDGVTRALE